VRFDVSTKKHPNTFAEVDDEDWPLIRRYTWSATRRRKKLYVRGYVDGRLVLLHRFLMGEPPGLLVDHRNGDTLNNRRSSNLRVCTVQQNNQYALESGAFEHMGINASHVHTVRRVLADGSVRLHFYHRKTRERLRNPELENG